MSYYTYQPQSFQNQNNFYQPQTQNFNQPSSQNDYLHQQNFQNPLPSILFFIIIYIFLQMPISKIMFQKVK